MISYLRQFYALRWKHGSAKTMLKSRTFRISILVIVLTIFSGEFLIYYLVLGSVCGWPRLSSENALKAMIISDPHILGKREGHWFDKLRREWQMARTFQAAMMIFNPDVVFVLGDLMDEGDRAGTEEIEIYAAQFRRIFNTRGRPLYAAVGNHDIGFHYAINERKIRWFYDTFHLDSVHMINIRGVIFVLLNSMAFEGDHCRLCAEAERQLKEINKTLACVKKRSNTSNDCPGYHHLKVPSYSRPIVLQHFPFYRFSDSICDEPDQAPAEKKDLQYRQLWDCVSEDATDMILDKLQPRVAFDGHSHYGCLSYHTRGGERIPEYTVGSFSCRNTKNPAFLLATFTPSEFAVSKCLGVRENTVYGLYIVIFIIIPVIFIVHKCYTRCRGLVPMKRL